MQAYAHLHTFIKLRWPTFFGQAPKKLDKKVPCALPLAEIPFTIKKDRPENSLRKACAQTVPGLSLFLL